MPLYKIHGLYSGHAVIIAESEEEVRRLYHEQNPGWAGTILDVINLDEAEVDAE
jgi:hypothetical protein